MKKKQTKLDRVVKKYAHLWFMLLFPVVLFYYESVFRISTVGGYFSLSTLYMLFFCIAYGGILYLLCSIFKKRLVNRIITAVLLGATALPYLIEYFIFRQFKIFYDVNTITGGAEDAVGGFMDDIMIMIFSWDGFFKIVLYLLPLVLYLIFGSRFVPAYRSNLVMRLFSGACSVLFYVITILLITFNSIYQPLYTSQYNFQSAVGNFGLYSAVRLDIKNTLFPDDDLSFETPSLTDVIPVDQEKVEEFKEYGYNQLDIDFAALAEDASDAHKQLDEYVSSLTASKQNKYTGLFKGKNLIMITAEAFTKEVIDPELTPTLYRLSTKGINFTDYYQPASAGTTGGEYQNIFGMLPTAGGKSFKNTKNNLNYYTMGNQLNRLGYFGMAFHNNSYTYYDRHLTHVNLGYSGGYMGYGNGMEEYVTKAWPQSDLEMFAGTLDLYIDKQPFNVYYMSVSGHSGYSRTGNAMTKKNWDRVQHLNYSDTVKGYLAANLELEDALTHLVNKLEEAGIADDTVICLSTDHFPYGLDSDAGLGSMPYLSELYGYDVTDYFQRDHNALIIWSGCLEDEEPIIVDTPTYSLDILPTLSNLFGTEFDSRLMVGRDVFSDAEALVFNTNYDWKTEYGTYYSKTGKFVESKPLPEGTDVDEYVSAMKAIVRNKYKYCKGVLDSDYYAHVFGE